MQNNKKYKIAVCIGGELRRWKITQHLFNSFHGRYEDVDVDFFISTWNPIKERDSSGDVWLQEDVINSLDRLKGYEFLDKDCEQLNTSNQMKYYYLMYRCNLLKSEYELENNFNYDCVLVSRPDMAIEDIAALQKGEDYERTIDALYQFMMVYDGEKSNKISRGELVVGGLWWNPSAKYFGGYSSMDTVFWGRSSTMDIFTQVYKYVWNSKLFNSIERMHSLPPSWSRYAGLVPMGNQHSPGVILNILRRENEKEYEKYFETEECLCRL
tara:strand:+ start:136 stop:942 length:807 start_codon:yes stop_codon:yes gene_type:complete